MSIRESRRSFLRSQCLATAGGALLAMTSGEITNAEASEAVRLRGSQGESPEQRLRELGIELPPPPRPVAVYVTAVRTGNILFTAGHTPRYPDGSPMPGKVGATMTVEEGNAAARVAGLNLLSTVRDTLGSLDEVVRLVKV
ncbi:MAG TPA: RidA family protein, partial [Acidobacteriota bacterium]|nr:RidA family protein [Acidobacteriota bacterium]